MKVRRRGGLRLELGGAERLVILDLFRQFEALLADGGGAGDDAVLARLFPDAYPDDPEASAEFAELTRGTARQERTERIERCRAEVDANGHVDLADPDDARRWIQAVNDLRLAIGTRIGVSADNAVDFDPGDPAAQPWVVYHWLTAMQDQLVTAMMR